MARWRIITVPLLTVLPFGLAGLLGARHTPSTLPPCLEAVRSVDFDQSPIDGLWVRQIRINNCGGAPVALDGVDIDGPGHAAGFSLMGPTRDHIDVDAPLTLTVGFTPEKLGTHSGSLRISVGGRSLLEVDLLGEGTLPAPRLGESCGTPLPGGFVARSHCRDERLRLGPAGPTPTPVLRSAGVVPDADPTDAQPPEI